MKHLLLASKSTCREWPTQSVSWMSILTFGTTSGKVPRLRIDHGLSCACVWQQFSIFDMHSEVILDHFMPHSTNCDLVLFIFVLDRCVGSIVSKCYCMFEIGTA